jgi:hypothetical protein
MKTPHDVKEKLKTPHNLSPQRNGGTARARGRQRQRTKAPPMEGARSPAEPHVAGATLMYPCLDTWTPNKYTQKTEHMICQVTKTTEIPPPYQ